MGDVGALGLGAALGAARLTTNTHAAAADHLRPARDRDRCRWRSRWASYRLLRPQRRIFRMAPIHHHFELDRLAGDDGDHPLLADLGHLRGRRPRHLLRRLRPPDRGGADGPARRSSTGWPSPARRRRGRCVAHGWRGDGGRRPRRPPTRADAGRRARRRAATRRRRRRARRALVGAVDLVVPSPGVPEAPPRDRVGAARRRAGAQRDRPRLRVGAGAAGRPRPMLAVTGTDGKTTTTLLATAMLDASGVRAVAAGNTEVPLVARARPRRRGVRRRVHELPAGLDRRVPARRRPSG